MAKRTQAKNLPGRPAVVRGRGVVVTVSLTPEASERISSATADTMSIGDAIETLIGDFGSRVRLPEPMPSSSGRWAPVRFEGRSVVRRLRLSDQAIAALDAIGKSQNAVRGDVIEALIRQHAGKLGRKRKR
jgi:hypothetical protein